MQAFKIVKLFLKHPVYSFIVFHPCELGYVKEEKNRRYWLQ
jgi:hypothetical protein